MSGAYLEQRLLGMAMADPTLVEGLEDLDKRFAVPDHIRAWRLLVDLKTSDPLVLAEYCDPDFLDYLLDLRDHESFSPQNWPAYVRAVLEVDRERAYQIHCSRRLRPHKSGSPNPFKL